MKIPMQYVALGLTISFDHYPASSQLYNGMILPFETWAVCLDGEVLGSIEKQKNGWEFVLLCEVGHGMGRNHFGPEFTLEQVQEEWLSAFAPHLPVK